MIQLPESHSAGHRKQIVDKSPKAPYARQLPFRSVQPAVAAVFRTLPCPILPSKLQWAGGAPGGTRAVM